MAKVSMPEPAHIVAGSARPFGIEVMMAVGTEDEAGSTVNDVTTVEGYDIVSGTVTDAPGEVMVSDEDGIGNTVNDVNVDEPDVTVTALVVSSPVLWPGWLPPFPGGLPGDDSGGGPLVGEGECGGSEVVGWL